VSELVAAAVIAALASVVGSVLAFFLGIRQGASIGGHVQWAATGASPGIEARCTERRLDRLDRSMVEVREWHAFRAGRDGPPPGRPAVFLD
jgi:hypothetical protein